MIPDVITALRGSFAPGAHSELRAQRSLTRRVTLLKGDVTTNTRSESQGVSARVYQGGVYGFASQAELSQEAARQALKTASDNAAFLDGHARLGKGALPDLVTGTLREQEDFVDLPQKHYLDYLRPLDEYIKSKVPGPASRALVAYSDSMEKAIMSSDGYTAHIIAPRSYIYLFLNGRPRTACRWRCSRPLAAAAPLTNIS